MLVFLLLTLKAFLIIVIFLILCSYYHVHTFSDTVLCDLTLDLINLLHTILFCSLFLHSRNN